MESEFSAAYPTTEEARLCNIHIRTFKAREEMPRKSFVMGGASVHRIEIMTWLFAEY